MGKLQKSLLHLRIIQGLKFVGRTISVGTKFYHITMGVVSGGQDDEKVLWLDV